MKSFGINWQKSSKWRKGAIAGAMAGHERRLLLSRGALMPGLESIFRAEVGIEVKRIGYSRLSPDIADYLNLEPDIKSLEREVWLTVNKKRLVFARSVFPVACTEKRLLDIIRKGKEPLGRVISLSGMRPGKKSLEIGLFKDSPKLKGLGLAARAPFFARRYRLSNRKKSGQWITNCAVIEVFSSKLITAPE